MWNGMISSKEIDILNWVLGKWLKLEKVWSKHRDWGGYFTILIWQDGRVSTQSHITSIVFFHWQNY